MRNISYSNHDFFETDGPYARRAHSLTLRHHDRVLIFGGQSNNEQTIHEPKTFEIEEIDGQLEFTSYDQKPTTDCDGKVRAAAPRGRGCKGMKGLVRGPNAPARGATMQE